ncbi:NAD(P)H-hydrate epimerase [Defluviimonas salinarum]|uniref:Multifunctional fusion protein n=1 Tax=Defluviimonas salinarum TaxID=2992147 RepID=A0ABT3J3B7_9RHOB|nr:NAD(P)H-hydrate epimerase [Defluviimonas salinarum]MCW3782192.1 NAD(P)H-hydrate epimerase [Defluviimonas salinarum]
MTELLTAAQMRAIEQAAIASGEVTGLELMERAGRGVVEAIFEEWPELAKTSHRAVVLCGPGNNGGDGFVVARRLLDKGWEVEVYLYGDPAKLPPDARRNYDVWVSMGEVLNLKSDAVAAGARPVLLVDAMFGTGLRRAIPLDLAEAHHAIEKRAVGERHPWLVPFHRVAVDCPSGLDCDSGKFLIPPPPAVDEDDEDAEKWSEWWLNDASKRLLRTNLTVTFHRRKIGHSLSDVCGPVRVVDIGLGREDRHPSHLMLPRSSDQVIALDFDRPAGHRRVVWPASELFKRTFMARHKYDYGHALVLSGGTGRGGAARLAVRGALRIGAGLVTVGCPPEALTENAARLDAVMLKPVADADAFGVVLEDERINALCLGPGLGTGAREVALVAAALGVGAHVPPPPSPPHEGEGSCGEAGGATGVEALPLPLVGRGEGRGAARAVVLDADALTILACEPGLFAALHDRCVLTPHAGEFARLFPDIAEKLAEPATKGPAYSKVDATREAAARAGCVVLFKGPDTVIADPSGRCSINSAHYDRAAPWLATAGSGDVLAGFIAGLLARGLAPMPAAEAAAWLHVECARKFGPGLIAEDLPEELPAVFRDLGL